MAFSKKILIAPHIKAQFWSFDAIFAVVIFSTAITILAFVWAGVSSQLSLASGAGDVIMQAQAQTFAQTLLSQGTPPNWQSAINTTNTQTWSGIGIGLGSSASGAALSMQKVYTLMAMSNYNYQATKQSLGVGYEYYITIYNSAYNITIGSNPATGKAMTVYVATESVSLDGMPAVMKVELWTPQELAIT
jgi:hypothetical protein